MKDKVYRNIYQTTDFDKFKRLKGNRDVRNTKRIIESIEKVGYVLSPILVNEDFYVIDGQNRLDALRQLNMPVIYMVQEGIGIDECRALNINQSNWTSEQFIVSYAENGIPDYERLLDLVQTFKNKGFNLDGVLLMTCPQHVSPKAGGSHYQLVKSGEFVLSEERYEISKARMSSCMALKITDFKKKYEMAGRTFWGAISYAYEHQEVDIKVLAQKLWDDPLAIVSTANTANQLRYFEEAYNKGRKAANRVYMSTDFLKRKYITEEELR